MSPLKYQIFSVPNILSMVRLLLIPFFVIAYQTQHYLIAAFVVLLSGLTDFADGQIARRFHMITDVGKVLDPIADKLTQAAIVFCLAFRYTWMIGLIILFVVKELTMAIFTLLLLRRGKRLNGAHWYGKVSTAVFYLVMFILLIWPSMNMTIANVLIAFSGIFLLLSFILYSRVYIHMLRDSRQLTHTPTKRGGA